jgi:hypothetical protein
MKTVGIVLVVLGGLGVIAVNGPGLESLSASVTSSYYSKEKLEVDTERCERDARKTAKQGHMPQVRMSLFEDCMNQLGWTAERQLASTMVPKRTESPSIFSSQSTNEAIAATSATAAKAREKGKDPCIGLSVRGGHTNRMLRKHCMMKYGADF